MDVERWIAVVNSKGELVSEPEPYTGPADDGCSETKTSYGTSFQGVASTKEAAIEAAEACAAKAQDVPKS